jgi:hypothetical protein
MGAEMMNHEELISNYLSGASFVRNAVEGMSQEQLLAKPIPGKWSTHQVVCHLADTEALYAERMKRVIAEHEPTLLSMDPDAWMTRLGGPERVIEEELRLIDLTRNQMVRILRTLKLDEFQRRGIHSEDGPLTLETVLTRITGHMLHHVRFINEKKRALGEQ